MVQLQESAKRKTGALGAGRRIYELLRAQIADGTLAPGARAPSTRALAAELGVSRTTVTAAYEQLAAEGFLVTSMGRSARIASPFAVPSARFERSGQRDKAAPVLAGFGRRLLEMGMPALPNAAPVRFDFLYGAVAARDFPSLAWRRAYQAELMRQQASLYYAPPEGDES